MRLSISFKSITDIFYNNKVLKKFLFVCYFLNKFSRSDRIWSFVLNITNEMCSSPVASLDSFQEEGEEWRIYFNSIITLQGVFVKSFWTLNSILLYFERLYKTVTRTFYKFVRGQ